MGLLQIQTINHTFREGNAPADILAKASCGHLEADFVFFDQAPPNINTALLADQMGIAFFRICNFNPIREDFNDPVTDNHVEAVASIVLQ